MPIQRLLVVCLGISTFASFAIAASAPARIGCEANLIRSLNQTLKLMHPANFLDVESFLESAYNRRIERDARDHANAILLIIAQRSDTSERARVLAGGSGSGADHIKRQSGPVDYAKND